MNQVDGYTFCLGPGLYFVRLNGVVVGATWPDQGSAKAGLEVERRRFAKRSVSLKLSPKEEGHAVEIQPTGDRPS